jgi:hypothetical protein
VRAGRSSVEFLYTVTSRRIVSTYSFTTPLYRDSSSYKRGVLGCTACTETLHQSLRFVYDSTVESSCVMIAESSSFINHPMRTFVCNFAQIRWPRSLLVKHMSSRSSGLVSLEPHHISALQA